MQDDNYDYFDEMPFQNILRPKGAHMFRVYSMKNRSPFEFYYRAQLIEWARLEFEGHLISFAPVNKVFKIPEGSLFVAFKLEYLNSEVLAYIAESGREAVEEAFAKCCSAMGVTSKRLGQEVIRDAKLEVWNRLKILSLITRWKHEITAVSIMEFIFSLNNCSSCALNAFDEFDGFNDGRGQAFALEMVRIGKFQLPSLQDRLIAGSTVVVCSTKGDA